MRHTTQQKGFAMLFTVLIMTLILTIALGISNVTFKQTILSSIAKDSEVAFYQADAGIECALYYDLNVSHQSFNGVNTVPTTIDCGEQTLKGGGAGGYYTYSSDPIGSPCISLITIDKTGSENGVPIVDIVSHGNNICQNNPRQVERALEVKYNQ